MFSTHDVTRGPEQFYPVNVATTQWQQSAAPMDQRQIYKYIFSSLIGSKQKHLRIVIVQH